MIYISISYKTILSCGSIPSALPSYLIATNNSTHGSALVINHIKSILTNPGVGTGTNPKYIAYSYNVITNLNLNREDAQLNLS